MRISHSNELSHYGVKGMKWGKHKKATFKTNLQNVLSDDPTTRQRAKEDLIKSGSRAAEDFTESLGRKTEDLSYRLSGKDPDKDVKLQTERALKDLGKTGKRALEDAGTAGSRAAEDAKNYIQKKTSSGSTKTSSGSTKTSSGSAKTSSGPTKTSSGSAKTSSSKKLPGGAKALKKAADASAIKEARYNKQAQQARDTLKGLEAHGVKTSDGQTWYRSKKEVAKAKDLQSKINNATSSAAQSKNIKETMDRAYSETFPGKVAAVKKKAGQIFGKPANMIGSGMSRIKKKKS